MAGPPEVGSYPDRYNLQGSVSYVTGSHNIKVGVQDSYGPYNQRYCANGDMTENFLNVGGVLTPSTATIYSTSPVFQDKLNAALGLYAQDAWTMKRLTINYALRYDYLNEQVTGQPIQEGTFAVIPAFGNIQMPTQTNWSPHVSVVYDLTGNGKTAIRAGFNRFPNAATTGLAGTNDPANGALITATQAWTDLNGDNIAEYSVTHNASGQVVGCVYLTPGCELEFNNLTSNFGSVTISNKLDPGLKRPFYDQTNLGISHELVHGVSVTAEWFRTVNKDIQAPAENLTNLLPAGVTDPTQNPNFRAFTVYSPIDGHAVTMYDSASAAVSALPTNNLIFTDPNESSVYNGVDLGFNARLPKGARLFGGTTTERTLTNTCDLAVYNPNNLLYCNQAELGGAYSIPWKTQFKLSGTYPLPFWGLIASGTYQALPGYTEGQTTYAITKASKVVTCPGNSAASGCVVGATIDPTQVTGSINALLDPSNVTLTPRTNELDVSLAKRLKFGRLRIDPKIDLFNALNTSDYFTVRSTAFSPIVGPAGVNGPAIPANALGTLSRASVSRAAFCRAVSCGWART